MRDDSIPVAPGKFSQADPSPLFFLSCPRCSRKHDGAGAKKWLRNGLSRLMICRHCVADREARKAA